MDDIVSKRKFVGREESHGNTPRSSQNKKGILGLECQEEHAQLMALRQFINVFHEGTPVDHFPIESKML